MMCLLIPLVTASYAVRVPQYRCLQSGLLQCMNHFKPPCHLLMLRVTNPAHKRLALFGFLLLRTIFTIQGAHNRVCSSGGTDYIISHVPHAAAVPALE